MQRYAISRRRALPAHAAGPLAALEERVTQWAAAGVEWIQVREKDLPAAELEALTARLAFTLRGSASRLLLNGLAPDRAHACGAHGVHLAGAASAAAIREARRMAGLVSVSCHTLDDVTEAVKGQATLMVWAPVFGKVEDGVAVRPGTGIEALAEACEAAGSLPVLALGGVTLANAPACLAAGARGVAGIRLFAGEDWRSLG